jgi:hypothetical protein
MEELHSAYKEVGPKRYRETTAVVPVMLVGLYALPSAPLARAGRVYRPDFLKTLFECCDEVDHFARFAGRSNFSSSEGRF